MLSESEITHLNDTYLLALTIWREARGEPLAGKVAVADVILQRRKDPRWRDSVAGVISQPLQFSAFNSNDPNSKKWPAPNLPDWKAFVECYRVAELALATGPSGSIDHYHAKSVSPNWSKPEKVKATIGAHIFLGD